jgi:F-type H+-transporting ATPase subunit b
MQIDWITVGAQLLNFLVLVWLLNMVLYRPVTRAMESRAAAIRDRFAEAERREAEASREAELCREERAAIEERRAGLLAGAQEEARALAHRLEHEARDEIGSRRDAWADQLRVEQARFVGELRHHVAGHVARVARRVLSDLAGAELEAAMADNFITRIRGLDGKVLADLCDAAGDAEGEVSIASASVLKAQEKARLDEAVRETIHAEARITYLEDADLICGLRLRIGGQTLEWNVDDYLDALQDSTGQLLEAAGSDPGADRAGRR